MENRLSVPEQTFLVNNPNVGPCDMADCIIGRTEAIVSCMVAALEDDTLIKKTNLALLWQIDGNLEMLKKLVDKYMPIEDQPARQGGCPLSLKSSCGGGV